MPSFKAVFLTCKLSSRGASQPFDRQLKPSWPLWTRNNKQKGLLSSAAQTWPTAESKCELIPRERAAERPVYVSGDSFRTENNISKHVILEFLEQSP